MTTLGQAYGEKDLKECRKSQENKRENKGDFYQVKAIEKDLDLFLGSSKQFFYEKSSF